MRDPVTSRWRQPVLTVVAMALTLGLVELADSRAGPGALVLAAVLALTLSRNHLVLSWQGRLEALLLLPLVALGTHGVGLLLRQSFWIGALAYVFAMFVSIWLRRFGPVWKRIGSLLALPFITLLIVPHAGGGPTLPGVIALSLVALIIAVTLQLLAESTGFLPRPARASKLPEALSAQTSSLRPIASTRMAIQLALALAAAFTLGRLLFPGHWSWVVLTAFLVCSGNRGRADVLHKSGLRILGAVAGVAAALIVSGLAAGHLLFHGPALGAVLLAVVGVGLWAREFTYAAWAFAMTLAVALLQNASTAWAGTADGLQLWMRVEGIVVGAVCGLASSWFVLPVRSRPVLRRRIADTLAALGDCLADRTPENEHALDATLARIDEVSPPWKALQRFWRWRGADVQPAHWIDLVHDCVQLARSRPRASGAARRALGEARRAMRDPAAIGASLADLRTALSSQPPWGGSSEAHPVLGRALATGGMLPPYAP